MTTIKRLRYGNTNTYFISGERGGLLIDTDYAGTLPGFFKSIKSAGISTKMISYVIATHYHPDHIGLIGELQKLGIKLLLIDIQKDAVHFSDEIFSREGRRDYIPINESAASVISCENSKDFLHSIGIGGEIIHTPSHSKDSISIILEDGSCFVGDLEPKEYLGAYDYNTALQNDWDHIMSYDPKHIFYAHVNDKEIDYSYYYEEIEV